MSDGLGDCRQVLVKTGHIIQQVCERGGHPLAPPETPGAFPHGLRGMAVDGSLLDVPDTPSNARLFGYPGSRFDLAIPISFLHKLGTS